MPAEIGYERTALLIAKEPFDATNFTDVEGFTITGEQPAGTVTRIAFLRGGNLYRFNGADMVDIGDLNAGNVLANGNVPAELTALTDIPFLVGKKIYPVIALHADADTKLSPTIKIGLKVRSNTAAYEKIIESPQYTLAADGDDAVPRIADIFAHTTCHGKGSVTIQVRLQNERGEWTNYMPLTAAAQEEALAVQFRITYNVTKTDGTDSAKVDSITVRHNMGATAVSGDVAELYSVIRNYETALQTCYVIVRHKFLRDSVIRAYVNFMQPPKTRELIFIGQGTGSVNQYILGVDGVRDTGIDQNTLKIFVDGEMIDEFGYNVEVNEVTVNAPVDAAITASYEYGHGVENWLEMSKLIDSQPYLDEENTYMSRFSYTLPDDDAIDTTLSNVRISLERSSGSVKNESLGTASGLIQQVVLPHAAKQETISLNADWSYNPDNRVLTYVAAEDTELLLSYDYVGEQQIIYSFAAGWAVKI